MNHVQTHKIISFELCHHYFTNILQMLVQCLSIMRYQNSGFGDYPDPNALVSLEAMDM